MQRIRLETIRKRNRITPKQMGEIIGKSASTYLRYEKNPQLLDVGEIWKICDYFHMDVQELDLFFNCG